MRRWIASTIVVLASVGVSHACSFACSTVERIRTMREEMRFAKVVVVGTLDTPRVMAGDRGASRESTKLKIESVLKGATELGQRRELVLPRSFQVVAPTDPPFHVPELGDPPRFLVFCDVRKDKPDPYRIVNANTEGLTDYLKGVSTLGKDTNIETLKYYFRYLDSSNPEVARDSFLEVSRANDAIVRDVAQQLDPNKLRGLLKRAPAERIGFLAFLLTHCGKSEDAVALKQLLDQAKSKRHSVGINYLLASYVLLKPEEGWAYLLDWLADSNQEFLLRYAGLLAVRFLWENRPEVVGKKKMVNAVAVLLDQLDIADMAIGDLRKWGRFEIADRVLALYDRESHQSPIVRRAILKYALMMPDDDTRATKLLKRAIVDDPELLADIGRLLKLEQETARLLAGED